ncbi:MAG: GNAT family N-acetyltransferase [Solobacterium sp.]|nr:GNAT family N-acetyltransferase [Solobacterium sp.]
MNSVLLGLHGSLVYGGIMGVRAALEMVSNELWSNERVSIRTINTEADLIYVAYECQLEDWQKELVNPAWFSIGRAYLFKEDNYPCIICNEELKPIGFINLCKWLGEGDAFSFSYYIDKNYQGKGYGKSAAEVAIQILKAADSKKPIKLATERENKKAQGLYTSLGFKLLNELDGDDLVFAL